MEGVNGKNGLKFEEVLEFIRPIFGKACCRKQVGLIKSMKIGFGEKGLFKTV